MYPPLFKNIFMDVKDIVFALKEFSVRLGGGREYWENKEVYLFYFYFLYSIFI